MLLDVKRTEKWIAALEANGHRQYLGGLRNPYTDQVCAMGAIFEVDPELKCDAVGRPLGVVELLPIACQIISLNDGDIELKLKTHTFAEIANILKIRLRAQQEFIGVIQEKHNATTNCPTSITA
jgi:hypothetical protein